MEVGVFGKLPARRDFVQYRADPCLMKLLDPWVQGCLAESRRLLDERWLDAWLTAPIWRFWWGRRVCGVTALGAMMPSVDGVGRYFPLFVLCACEGLPPPDREAQSEWFPAVEALMLGALAEGATYEDLLAGLDMLPRPVTARRDGAGDASASKDDCSAWWAPSAGGTADAPPLVCRGLPNRHEYAALIAPGLQHVPAPAAGST